MSEPKPTDAPKQVFVISPIAKAGTEAHQRAKYFLDYLVREALPEPDWIVKRADESDSPDSISQDVVNSIYTADVVVADLSTHNPNVFYELAMAHGWRRPVVHLIADGESIPFDIVDQRTIFYDLTDLGSVAEAKRQLRASALYAMSNAESLFNPISAAQRFAEIRSDTHDGGGNAVAEALEQVNSRLASLERRMGASRAEAPPEIVEVSRPTQGRPLKKGIRVNLLDDPNRPDELPDYVLVTERQWEIGRMVSQGLTNADIGEKLFLSTETVDLQIARLMRRLRVRDRAELAVLFHAAA